MSTIRNLRGDDVAARDGIVGLLDDVYFDHERWAVRYFAVDTGAPGGRLLVPPRLVDPGLSSGHTLRLALTLEQLQASTLEDGDEARLCSGAQVIGCAIEARDGAIGEVQDLVLDDDWRVREVVVDTTKWWPGGLVSVHPEYVERIDRDAHKVHLRLTRQQVKLSGAVTPRR